MRTGHLVCTDKAQMVTAKRRLYLGGKVTQCHRLIQPADPSQACTGNLVLQRQQIISDLLVGMDFLHFFQDA